MWILITIGILAVLLVLFVLRKEKTHPMDRWMALGGLAGMLIGIGLVELYGFEYPVPFILWMLGMAGGQLIGWFYKRK
jgi:hypothetical protein